MTVSDTKKLIDSKLSNPDFDILTKIKNCTFTAHNIPLTHSESTMGYNIPLLSDDIRTQVIKNNLYIFTGKRESLSGFRLLDLGCLEGGLSFEMASEGMDVLGVEGRESNFLKCQLIQDYFNLPNLNFLLLDVKNLDKSKHGVFDIILCCGLLYHLNNPFPFLELLNSITHDKSILFLDTHFAPPDDKLLDMCKFKDNLSNIESLTYSGITYEGRWYREHSDNLDQSDDPWASVSNALSFWPTFESLIKALNNANFMHIYNLYGGLHDIDYEFKIRKEFSRLYCFALKETYFE